MSPSKNQVTFSLTKKMVIGMVGVSCVTYGTSAFFIFMFSGYFSQFLPKWLYTMIILTLGVIWSGILGYFAARFITKVIADLQKGVTKAAEGDLTVSIKISQTKDELMLLSQHIQKMIGNLRRTVLDIHTYSEKTQEKVEYLTSQVMEASEQSKMIGQTIEEIATGAERQSQSALATFDAIQEAMGLADRIGNYVQNSYGLSQEMVQTLEEGEKAVRSSIKGILNLAETNQTQSQKINELSRDAKEIGSVTKVIRNIVEQTHLLALNATIEAARAGEEGRGFSVVASEIQKLAIDSSESLKRIDELIKQIQFKVEEVVSHIQNQLHLVSEESQKAHQTDQAISKVKESVLVVADAIGKIKADTEEQKQAVSGIMEDAQEVAAVAEQTSAASEEVAASALEQGSIMGDLAKDIQDLAGRTLELVEQIKALQVS